jgi:hypothetical protein
MGRLELAKTEATATGYVWRDATGYVWRDLQVQLRPYIF